MATYVAIGGSNGGVLFAQATHIGDRPFCPRPGRRALPSGADGARRVGSFRASLAPVPHDRAADNGSNASGRASLVLFDDHLTAFVFARGLSPNLPHAMHIHGHEEAVAECPSLVRAARTA